MFERLMNGHLLERWILFVQVNLDLTILNIIGININEHDEIFYFFDVRWLIELSVVHQLLFVDW